MKLRARRLAPALFLCLLALAACAEKRPAAEASAEPAPAPPAAETLPETVSPVSIPEVAPEAVAMLDAPPVVRVLVVESRRTIRLRVPGASTVGADAVSGVSGRIERGGDLSVRASDGEIVLADGRRKVFGAKSVFVAPADGEVSTIDGASYRGGFLFVATRGGVAAINVIDIDEYLKGVLPSEIGYLKGAQYEAFRAQAFAARSYALSKLGEKRGELYDLNATVMDQVYRGASSESEAANRAVDETRGLVCAFLGEPARAYYCSCCGGHTADIRAVWPWKTPYPYLYGVRDTVLGTAGESLCRGSRHFRWTARWSASDLSAVLHRTIPRELHASAGDVGRILDVRPLGTGRDGRVAGLEIETDRESFTVQGDRIRWVLKPDPGSDAILRSTLFNMDVSRSGGRVASIDVLGGGNGHGVGMCQTGAIRMAELGYSGEQIISHYYPGVRIVTLYR